MKRIVPFLLALFFGTLIAPQVAPAQQQPKISHTFLKVGEVAPDFTLRSDEGTSVTLSSYRGKKNVILAFYVLAFTTG